MTKRLLTVRFRQRLVTMGGHGFLHGEGKNRGFVPVGIYFTNTFLPSTM